MAASHRTTSRSSASVGYWQRSQWPLQSLFFLLPLVAIYEILTLVYATDYRKGVARYIYARSLLKDFFEWLGATGYYLPGLIVVVVLLCLHFTRKDPWFFDARIYGLMLIESIGLALPLFVFMLVLARQPAVQWALETLATATGGTSGGWQARLVFSIGAGIYEELLFRLIGIALLHMILVDILALPENIGAAGCVILSAVAFALYHFTDQNPFTWAKCLLYTGAGIYFAVVYVLRGFGIVAGTHAMYDVMVVALTASRGIGDAG